MSRKNLFYLISFVAFLSSIEAIQLSQILLSEYGYSNNSVLIDLSSKNIESIDVNTFIGFTNLQVLYLNKNKLSRLNEPVFKNISNLKEIWLEENSITSFSKDSFVGLVNLERICLYDNPISTLFPNLLTGLCSTSPNCKVTITEKCLMITTRVSTTFKTTSIRTTTQLITTTEMPIVNTFFRETLTLYSKGGARVAGFRNDENLLISDSESLQIWNVESGELITNTSKKVITSLSVMPNDNVITGDNRPFITIWDNKLNVLEEFRPSNSLYTLNNILVLSDRLFAVSNAINNSVDIYDSKKALFIKRITTPVSYTYISSLAIAKNVYLAIGITNGYIQIYEVNYGGLIVTLNNGGGVAIRSLAVLKNSNIAATSESGVIKIWSSVYGILIATLNGHTDFISCLTVLQNGYLISGSSDTTLKVWNVNGGIELRTLDEHRAGIFGLAVLDNSFIATGSADGTIKIWNNKTGSVENTIKTINSTIITLIVLQNGDLAGGLHDGSIRIWNKYDFSLIKSISASRDSVNCLIVLKFGYLVSGSSTIISVWDEYTGQIIQSFYSGSSSLDSVLSLAELQKSGNNINIASAARGGYIRIWDLASGQIVRTIIGAHTGSVNSLAVLSNGYLVSGGADKLVKIWETNLGLLFKTLTGHINSVKSLAVLSDDYIASGSADSSTIIWNINTGRAGSFDSHVDHINALALHPNGNLITASSDNTAKIWYFNKKGFISELFNVNAQVYSLATLNDNKFAASLSNNRIKIYSPLDQ